MPKDVEYYISKDLDHKMAEYFASGRKHIIVSSLITKDR